MTTLLNFGTTDQKKQLNKLKHDLEDWREIILHASRILTWEKPFYPAVIFAAVTLQFLLLWYLDFSELTLFALTLLWFNLLDYVYPIVGKLLFKPDKWTGVQEKEFEGICVAIFNAKQCIRGIFHTIIAAKEKKSTLKKQLNKLKHDLEDWREIILHASRILTWEKPFYPAVIFAAVTLQFLLLWYLDFSELTLFALTLLWFNLLDYVYPIVGKLLFKPDKWTGVQEKEFEGICCICGIFHTIIAAKEKKSTLFVVVVSGILLFLAWIGSTIDNLLLSYLATLLTVYYPGLCKIGVIAKIKDILGGLLGGGGAAAATTKTE
uniref:Putative conserved plasma membrane protein n=1 Tax=Lutzomyia longipalpis TaxID=7200 RepID=A0A1B0GJ34_LUTLO